MIAYQTDRSWSPDPVYVNANIGMQYLAWQIGDAPAIDKSLWIIAPVVDTPEPLSNILPDNVEEIEFIEDVNRYGFTRTVLVTNTVVELQQRFLEQVASMIEQVQLGNR